MSSIAKNTAFMTTASILQRVISFVYFMIVARAVGDESLGKYVTALSITTIAVVFVDLGLSNVLVRESAKFKDKIQTYFSTILAVKIVLGIISYIGMVIIINSIGNYDPELKYLIYISGITMLCDSFHLSIYGVLRSLGNLKYEAIGVVGSQLTTLIIGSIFVFLKLPLIFLMLAFLVPSVCNALYASGIAYKKYGIKIIPKYDQQIFKHLFHIAIPFALAVVFARIYGYIDSVLVQGIAGNEVAGWYGPAQKISHALEFVPVALMASLYPRFSEYFQYEKERLSFLFYQGFKYLLIISLPLAIGAIIIAPRMMPAVFGPDFIHSVLPFQIIMISLIFGYINFLFGALLNACNKQSTQTTLIGIIMVLNIVLNFIYIQRLGVIGAAMVSLAGSMVLTVISSIFVAKITQLFSLFIFKTIIQVGIAAGVMGLAVWYTNIYTNFIVAIVVGIVIYPIMLFLTRTVTRTQLQKLFFLFRKENSTRI